ncbi:MFS transporter [Ruegeria marisrubri]|nr:MFS transporter [Ruegeria marisrubri]
MAGFLACAGVPLYIHLPRFLVEAGLSLSAAGALLLGLRMLDFVQDPLLGVWADRAGPSYRPRMAALALLGLGAGFAIVFVLQPGVLGLSLGLVLLLSAYSLGTILFYAQGVAVAGGAGDVGHFRLAGWRETGAVVGIIFAAMLPSLVASAHGSSAGYAALGIGMVLAAPLVWRISAPIWSVPSSVTSGFSLRAFRNAGAARLLLIGLFNAMPVAVTSTLFLFYVEDWLGAADFAGALLLAFFLAAGLAIPAWAGLAARYGARQVLLPAMLLAVFAFSWAALLPQGAVVQFLVVTVVSGAALGADMAILPALFATRLKRSDLPSAVGFGAWAFVSKSALALSGILVLPTLEIAGYVPGGVNDAPALRTLAAAYAIVPLFLKLPAIWMVARLADD